MSILTQQALNHRRLALYVVRKADMAGSQRLDLGSASTLVSEVDSADIVSQYSDIRSFHGFGFVYEVGPEYMSSIPPMRSVTSRCGGGLYCSGLWLFRLLNVILERRMAGQRSRSS